MKAIAKTNLFLRVLGKRSDSYHDLENVFVPLSDVYDEVELASGKGAIALEVEGASLSTDRGNLCLKAADAFCEASGCFPEVNIRLRKNIPIAAGLGGGSSDAATTLMVLNKLWNCGFTLQDLARIGVSLGADVPFFLFRQNAFVQGIGEIMTPIETPSGWFVVIKPPIFVPTKLIFQSPELTRSTERIRMESYPYFCDSYIKEGKNDLQPVAVSIFPEIQEALDDLGQYGNARMTGSGACVFAYFESEDVAREAEEGLSSKWEVMVIRSLKHHPLDLMGKSTGQ